MCIAIAHPEDAEDISLSTFERLERRHPDGHSLTWVRNGEIKTWKSLERLDRLYDQYGHLRDAGRNMMIHFRKATRGEVCLENCHPFFVNENLAFVHNGTISIPDLPEGKSDTVEFRDRILRQMPDNWLYNKDFRDMVNDYTEWSRFIFMTSDDEMYIINGEEGEWKDGTWFSNGTHETQTVKSTRGKAYSSWHGWADPRDDEDDDESVEIVDGAVSGYFMYGHAICATCIPEGYDETSDNVFDINTYYDAMDGYSELKACECCQHTIWPNEYLERFKNG